MRIKLLILTSLFLFLGINSAFAGEPPIQLSPSNNSTVTSSKLEWQIPSYPLYTGGSYYMIQVDDQQDFANPEKNNIYLTNNYYTPKLNSGTWYWRIKAKDSAGIWSNWSEGWSFNLNATMSTPSPTPQPTSPSTTAPSPTSSSASFTITNTPSQINSDQSFNVSANLSLLNNPNEKFYLKGAFKKAGSSNYFGLTKVSNSWIKNSSTYSNQFPITTDSSGNWSGTLEVKPDIDDSGFSGSGGYIFKVGRYTSAGSGPAWSNEYNINITATTNQTAEGSNEVSASNPSPSNIHTPTPQPKVAVSKSINTPKVNYQISSVAAITSSPAPSAKVEIKGQKQTNYFIWAGLILIFTGGLSIGYIYLRKNASIHITFRKRD